MSHKRRILRIKINRYEIYYVGLLVIFIVIFLSLYGFRQYSLGQINSFDDCIGAGLPVQQTYPPRCVVNGKVFVQKVSKDIISPSVSPSSTQATTPKPTTESSPKNDIIEPITKSISRISLKPFGIYVTPTDSPITPEKFTGFHTGTDFETIPGEADALVPIKAACTGKIRHVGPIDGYGGVVVQDCTISNQKVTVLYGHLDITSTNLKINDVLNQNSFVANLAAANSTASGGERKHLHLGIHIGEPIEYRGYIVNELDLSAWLNYQSIFK